MTGMNWRRASAALLIIAMGCRVQAQEPVPRKPPATVASSGVLTLESSAIRGNQELPKVMYIVPWKDPAMAELAGRPVNSLVEEVLAPVDREVFRRQTRYFSQLYAAGSAQSEAAVPGGPRDVAGSGRQSGQ
jgi:hypothetical protein